MTKMTKITERRQKQREADGKNGEKAKTAESTERANGFSCCKAADVWTYPKNRRPLPETPDAESDRGKSGRTYAAASLPSVPGGRADRVGTETDGRAPHIVPVAAAHPAGAGCGAVYIPLRVPR